MNFEENSKKTKMQTMESLSALFDSYKEDEYIIQKLNGYICNQLPNILLNLKEQQIKRKARFNEMTNEQDEFVQCFMNNNQYFYVQNTLVSHCILLLLLHEQVYQVPFQ